MADSEPTTNSVDEFDAEVRRVVQYFRKEFFLSYSEAVGVLEMVKHDLLVEVSEASNNDDS